MGEITQAPTMDQEPSKDNGDGAWFLVARKSKKHVQATSSLPPNMEPTQQGEPHGTLWKKGSQLPPLPIDLTAVFRPRDGLNQGELPQHFIDRALGTAAQLNERTLNQLIIRIRREQNVADVSTTDEDLATRLQLIKAICLANKEVEGQAYAAAADASCKGIISCIDRNTTPTTLMNF
ncbi:hypothetical protein HPB49_014628 [Dermacentor silvarum]|uniref:Uncharacterized protein n=1 Tax=Dermacentor silvarum TaxID=543639 RepID=A0ACB8C468_DERSI|nr:hypothetical protein HPB49_014628 [Dermacentor silvarum]